MVEVLISIPFNDSFTQRVSNFDARLRVRTAPPELRRWLRGDHNLDAAVMERARQQAADYLSSTEVLLGRSELATEALTLAPKLRWIQMPYAGIDKVDASAYGDIVITNASGVAAVPIAEYVIGVMLLFAKQFPRMLRNQAAHLWDRRFEQRELSGETCGIIGMGAIGEEIARRAKAMDMRVLGIRRSAAGRAPAGYADLVMPPADLDYLLAESDYVVIAAPHTPDTNRLMGARELATMRRTAVLINIGRGAIVDEQALITALGDGTIAGAGLDVFEREPLPTDSPLWDLPNVVATPHFSSGSHRYDERLADLVCDNFRRYLSGEPLHNVVDLAKGY